MRRKDQEFFDRLQPTQDEIEQASQLVRYGSLGPAPVAAPPLTRDDAEINAIMDDMTHEAEFAENGLIWRFDANKIRQWRDCLVRLRDSRGGR